MLEVREFKPEDAADVSRIMFDSFKTFLGHRMDGDKPTPPEEYARGGHVRAQWAHGQAFVAVDDGKVVGYINVTADLRRKLGTLGTIGVDPACMAHGAGTALFQAAWKFWMERDMNKIYTCTSSINTRAQRYYARMGFVEEGRRKRHFFDDVDEISLVIYPKRKETAKADVTIRPTTVEDAEEAAAMLAATGVVKGWDAATLTASLKSGNSVVVPKSLVAVDNATGKIVGAVHSSYIEKYSLAMTKFIYVAPEMRGKGIGGALFDAIAAAWNEKGPLRKADFILPVDAAAGMPFLMHCGYVVEEALFDHGGPGIPEIHLGKFFR